MSNQAYLVITLVAAVVLYRRSIERADAKDRARLSLDTTRGNVVQFAWSLLAGAMVAGLFGFALAGANSLGRLLP
jgi:hypothetical protein